MRKWISALPAGCFVLALAATALAAEPNDEAACLAKVRQFVEKSDRYLYHSHLKRGMKGYGLSVFAGTKIERFDVEIVSVIEGWSPQRAMILARCTGKGLEKSGIIAGMSGSPIFVRDPRDGKDKMIGALAYGWRFQNDPICGIQPIAYMLGMPGMVPELSGGGGKAKAGQKSTDGVGHPGLSGRSEEQFRREVLQPGKADFSRFTWPRSLREPPTEPAASAAGRPQLVPLRSPLMVGGLSDATFQKLSESLAGTNLLAVRSGGAGGKADDAPDAEKVPLEPGSGVAIPLVSGDTDWSAVGTVTEVRGDRVLAFGHAFFGLGELQFPMGPAYVHTIISSADSSFKLGSMLGMVGTLQQDEFVGVAGQVGPKAPTTPMTVTVQWPKLQRKQVMRYRLAHDNMYTPLLIYYLVLDSASAWRDAPELHHTSYEVAVDFGELGTYRTANLLSASAAYGAASDAVRPVAALIDNPYGPRIYPKSIDISLSILPDDLDARVEDLRLAGETWRPGETVRGTLTIRPYRKPPREIPVELALPEDMPEGDYTLWAGGMDPYQDAERSANPHLYRPRDTKQLLGALQRVVQPRGDKLYLWVPLAGTGTALEAAELPELPASRRAMLARAKPDKTAAFQRLHVATRGIGYTPYGLAEARFSVRKTISQTLTREKGD